MIKVLSLEKLCLYGLTGKGVNVAVVDSGINPWHSHVKGIAGGVKVGVNKSSRIVFDEEDIYDEIGHGTACAGVIRKKAPQANIYSVKIFERDLATYSVVLIEAIRWCIEKGIDIISLSLGTQNKEHLHRLREICRAAYQKGIIIVAAAKNGDTDSYPAYFPEVIAVTSYPGYQENNIIYNAEAPLVKFFASENPLPLPGLPQEYNFKGESFAGARLAGVMTLLREKYPLYGTEKIKHLLLNLG